MRLLVVTNDYPPRPGGIQQYLAGLVAAHSGEVRVLAPRDDAYPGDIRRYRRRYMWPTRRVRRWIENEARTFRQIGRAHV